MKELASLLPYGAQWDRFPAVFGPASLSVILPRLNLPAAKKEKLIALNAPLRAQYWEEVEFKERETERIAQERIDDAERVRASDAQARLGVSPTPSFGVGPMTGAFRSCATKIFENGGNGCKSPISRGALCEE